MDTSTVVSLTGSFLKLVGEVLADVKRQDLATLDADVLKLKRQVLSEKLEEFKSRLDTALKQEKGKAEQDLISRGLGNTRQLSWNELLASTTARLKKSP